jgi:hypothetical protein
MAGVGGGGGGGQNRVNEARFLGGSAANSQLDVSKRMLKQLENLNRRNAKKDQNLSRRKNMQAIGLVESLA